MVSEGVFSKTQIFMRQAYIIKELRWLKQEDPNWRSWLEIKI